MWVTVAFALWIVLLALFRGAGLRGRVLIAAASWLAARLAVVVGPVVIHWIVTHLGA